ncbi:MAG TPA: bifunctional diaminohydroxyphosphoribosylaminopyrimidine deaminase/5-amino-6-(5-phosphoribosylamino)uracil reductase RibD [Bryobacteraceae bacterium]|nr:bifunctional diaminohydroxyphosphoribosylaminopyrimidine deaminase/5-amino-6-(5-phosphoribosylamino)uracil reductase RibD [Bryobacteraceae bacterium]
MNPEYMQAALDLARQGVGRTSPNPTVGAVVVRDGEVVGRGYHTWAGEKHAEVIALEQAGERARGADLYVTLEPCCHEGRTGPCTEQVIAAGVKRVIAAIEDPNPQVAGKGFARLRAAGIEVELAADFEREAEGLNEAFAHFMRTGRPLVTLKAAVTLDGKISAPDDNQGWITSARARDDVQRLRHESDAIMSGIGTVLADDCLLTDRTGGERSRPLLRVIVDSQLRLPVSSRMATSANGDVVVATTTAASAERRRALEALGIRVWTLDGPGGRVNLHGVVACLARERYLSLMIEAGSKLNWSVLEAGVADKVFFYYAPKLLGGLQSLPVAGGTGRRSRRDAILLRDIRLHTIPPDEFAVEGWIQR